MNASTCVTFLLLVGVCAMCRPVLAADSHPEVRGAYATVYNMVDVKARAEQGDPAAQTLLAECYLGGAQGLATNRVEGYKWAVVAASQRHKDAKHVLAECDLFLSASDKANGKALAEAYLEKQKKAAKEPVGQNKTVEKPGEQKQATEEPAKP